MQNFCISILNDDVCKKIFYEFNFKELRKVSTVAKNWNKLINDKELIKKIISSKFCFNWEHWDKFADMGNMSRTEYETAFRLIPDSIFSFLQGPCPLSKNKNVMDTHILVWIPKTLNEKSLTINYFGDLLKQIPQFSRFSEGYKMIWSDVKELEGNKTIESGFVLMTKNNIPGSYSQPYKLQEKMVKDLNKKYSTCYEIVKAADAVICIYAEYLKTGERLFPAYPWEETRCQEKISEEYITIGGFENSGINIYHAAYSHNDAIGIAALWRI